MFKKVLTVFVALVMYLVYARSVLTPQAYKQFSLIDDGQSITNGYYFGECIFKFNCKNFITHIKEEATGTSRVFYWTILSVLYQKPFINAEFQHLLRIYFFGSLMVVALSTIAVSAGATPLAIVLGTAIFVTNYSFSENMIRLGPAEPYQVILLALFSLVYLNSDFIKKRSRTLYYLSAVIILILLFLVKETSIIILPAFIALWILFPKKNNIKDILLIFILPTLFYFLLARPFSGIQDTSEYASNYNLSPSFIIQNAKYFVSAFLVSTSPFLKLALLFLILPLASKHIRKQIYSRDLVYWLVMFVAFVVIFFPWKYVLDRYLLVAIFCFSVLIAILFSAYIEIVSRISFVKKHRAVYYLACAAVLIAFYLKGAPVNWARTINYRNWFIVFTTFEADQVAAIADTAHKGIVYINAKENLNNWEVLYEIPIHLRFFYQIENQTKRLEAEIPTTGYLFSRSSFDSAVPLEQVKKYRTVVSNWYTVSLIDPLAFRDAFRILPIQSIQSPPFSKEGYSYYWEIRKLEK